MKNKKLVIGVLSLLIVLLYLAPYFIRGEDSYILIHDSLDSSFVNYKILAESGELKGDLQARIPNMVGGLPRNVFPPEYNITVLLFYLFPALTAYIINLTMIHIVALVGMYLLLKKYITGEENLVINFGVATVFALLPFWPFAGLTVAGMPLFLYSFLNIKNKQDTRLDWLILSLIPFYTRAIFALPFFLFFIFLFWLYDFIVRGDFNIKFLFSIIIVGVVFLLTEYRLVYNMFFDNSFTSHRIEFFRHYNSTNLFQSLKKSLVNFTSGHYHAPSLQQRFVLPAAAIALYLQQKRKRFSRMFSWLLLATGLLSLWFGFWYWQGWIPIKLHIDLLRTFNFSRFHWLHPLLWYIIFALSLQLIEREWGKWGRKLIVFLLIGQIIFLFYSGLFISEYNNNGITYREFFSEELFAEIAGTIGERQEDYRVVSLGMHPSIAIYNGFYTLDGYIQNYSLEHKHEFKKVIKKELEKDSSLKNYFLHWGSRCYLFSAELGQDYLFTADREKQIYNLDLDTTQLREMGARYILSAVEVLNYRDNDLRLEDVFTDEDSPWKIYVYSIY